MLLRSIEDEYPLPDFFQVSRWLIEALQIRDDTLCEFLCILPIPSVEHVLGLKNARIYLYQRMMCTIGFAMTTAQLFEDNNCSVN